MQGIGISLESYLDLHSGGPGSMHMASTDMVHGSHNFVPNIFLELSQAGDVRVEGLVLGVFSSVQFYHFVIAAP